MNQKTMELWKELTQAAGIAGSEQAVSRCLCRHWEGLCDEVVYDNLGSVFAVKRCGKENAKRVMVCAHMDEVGLMLNELHDNGLASFIKIGNIADAALYAQQVRIQTRGGKEVIGTITADEESVKKTDVKKMYIDFGAANKEEALAMGVFVGDSAVLDGAFTVLQEGKRVMAKAADTRFGLALCVELLEAVRELSFDFDLYVGASVMEEVGQRGAATATGLIAPDLGIVLDGGAAADHSGKDNAVGKLGAGVLVRYYDKGMMPNRGLLQELVDVCQAEQIDHQYYYTMNLSDAAWIHKLFAGCPVLHVGICARNAHTAHAVVDLHDYDCAKQALTAVVKGLNEEKLQAFAAYNR